MKKNIVSVPLCCAALILGVFLFARFAKGTNTDIVITEIAAYETKDHEWIEIYNKGNEPVDLNGWTFWEGETRHGLNVIEGGTMIIEAGEYAIIAQNDLVFLADYPGVSTTVFDSSWGSLKESGEEIGLKDADDALVEQFTYIPAPNFSLERKDPSLTDYSEDNWAEHPSANSAGTQNYWHLGNMEPTNNLPPEAAFRAPTSTLVNDPVFFTAASSTDPDGIILSYHWQFGDAEEANGVSAAYAYTATGTYTVLLTVVDNDAATSTTSTAITVFEPETDKPEMPQELQIVINEIMPNPQSGEKEWIELYNSATTTADLAGISIEDGTGSIASPSSTIPAEGFLAIMIPSAKLNNSGDIIILKNAKNEEMDRVTYGDWEDGSPEDNAVAPKQGNALARITDGYDSDADNLDFAETDTPTPSEPNDIELQIEEDLDPAPEQHTNPPSATPTYYAGDILINELASDPADGFVEFVELYNTTSRVFSLDNWWIEEGSGSKTTLSGAVSAHSFFVVEKPKGNLNNSGDIVRLFAQTGTLIDRVAYGDWKDGNTADNAPRANDPMSVARMFDGKDTDIDAHDFATTTMITRGTSNRISTPAAKPSETETQPNTAIYPKHLIVTELLPNPEGPDDEEEFIELYNTGIEYIDLAGWKIGDESNRRYTLSDIGIAPGAYLALKRKTTGIALNNTGRDTITVLTPDGDTVDTISYENARDGESYAHTDTDAWQWTAHPTPGAPNRIAHAPTPNEAPAPSLVESDAANEDAPAELPDADIDPAIVVLSEFLPNPEGSDDAEFIELHNTSDHPIELVGLKLDDEEGGSHPYTIPDGIIAPADGYIVFGRAQTKLALNNTGDTVRMIKPNGEILDAVEYNTLPEGTSYAKNENREWYATGTPTPGRKNDFSTPTAVAGTKIQHTSQAVAGILIKDMHDADIGDRIQTVGTVVVEPDVFGSQYFYMVDAANSSTLPGVQVYMYNKDFPNLAVGDHIAVTGELSEVRGEIRVKIADQNDIETIDRTGEPDPIQVDISNIDDNVIGSFVEVHGEITEQKGSYAYIDDGTDEIKMYFKAGTNISKKQFRLGDLVIAKGIINKTADGYQLLPRQQSDITQTGVVEKADVIAQTEEKEAEQDAPEKYLTATAGGLTAILFALIIKSNAGRILSFFVRIRNKKEKL